MCPHRSSPRATWSRSWPASSVPADGEIVDGIGSIDESAITGESAPVIREAGSDRSAVTGGTRLLSDRLVVEVTQEPGKSFLDRMIALVEGAERRKTPNEIALNILLAGLTITFLVAVATLRPFALYAHTNVSQTVLIALLVALIPTTIGALLSAIGIAGMDRLVQRNVLAMSGRAVEASGDVDDLLLDKTGTITLGQPPGHRVHRGSGDRRARAGRGGPARLAGRRDARRALDRRPRLDQYEVQREAATEPRFVPFTAMTRMSGVDFNGTKIRKGAADAVKAFISETVARPRAARSTRPCSMSPSRAAHRWSVAETGRHWGSMHLKDIVKTGMRERFDDLRKMGIRTVMVTGDHL